MSWLRIDDRFEDHEKVEPLSDAAHRLWFRCACWCKKSENLRLGGLVPLRQVLKFCAGSDRILRKLTAELVEARGDAAYGHEHGLWEPRESAWQFHDWEKYQPALGSDSTPGSSDPDQRSESARKAGLASAKARRLREGTAQPNRRTDSERTIERPERRSTELAPNEASGASRTTFDRTDSERTIERPEPPDPDPRSQSGIAAAGSQDLTGFPRETAGSAAAAAADSGLTCTATSAPIPLGDITDLTRKYELAQKNPGAFALECGVRWPEFLTVWHAWCKPFGITEPPSITQRVDRDILAIVEAFASGKTLEQLLAAGKAAETDEYFSSLAGGGPASFTPAVLRRLLAPPRATASDRGRRNGPQQPRQPDSGYSPSDHATEVK